MLQANLWLGAIVMGLESTDRSGRTSKTDNFK